MVITKNTSKIYRFFAWQTIFFPLKFVGIIFLENILVKILFSVSIISSNVITESPLMLAEYLEFSKQHVAVF